MYGCMKNPRCMYGSNKKIFKHFVQIKILYRVPCKVFAGITGQKMQQWEEWMTMCLSNAHLCMPTTNPRLSLINHAVMEKGEWEVSFSTNIFPSYINFEGIQLSECTETLQQVSSTKNLHLKYLNWECA